MKNKNLVWIIIIWVAFKVLNYYFSSFILLPLILSLAFIFFFIMSIIRIKKTIMERKHLTKSRLQKLAVYSTLLITNFLYPYTDRLLEIADWHIQYNRRVQLVEQVRSYKLNCSTNNNNNFIPWCSLPYNIPVLSNNGNRIILYRDNSYGPKLTVEFVLYNGYIDQPATMLVYSDNPLKIAELENRIIYDSDNNWKIENNWYRTRGGF